MRSVGFVLLAAACLVAAPAAKKTPQKPAAPDPSRMTTAEELTYVDPTTAEILKRDSGVSPYEVPDLKLKELSRYAETPDDIEPFGGVQPYKRHFLKQMEYTGPGRAIPEPANLDSVKIGFIGPIMSTVSVATGGKSHEESIGIKMLQGAKLAVEQANEGGGYVKRKIPFEMVVANDNGLWGSTGNEVVTMAYKEPMWAILGTIDSANSHIAIRVALKAEMVMLNSGDTDPTFIETNIPWVMRCIGDDRQMGYLLIDYMVRKLHYKRIGIIRSSNRFGRFGVREIKDSARRLQDPVIIEMAYKVGGGDYSLQIERLKASNLDAVIHWGDGTDGALILNQMRKMGMNQPYFVNDRCASKEFVEIAGPNAEGVIAGFPWNPDRKDPKLDKFRADFRKRFNAEPDTYAAHAYDGMNMLMWAINSAGLNRAKIRDVLAYRPAWYGVTGEIPFSAALDDMGAVFLAKYADGKWTYQSREQLGIPKLYFSPRERVERGVD
jgi:branched-chain amino acid transport system substrate-binding protein